MQMEAELIEKKKAMLIPLASVANLEANHPADLYVTQAQLGKRFTSSRSHTCSD